MARFYSVSRNVPLSMSAAPPTARNVAWRRQFESRRLPRLPVLQELKLRRNAVHLCRSHLGLGHAGHCSSW